MDKIGCINAERGMARNVKNTHLGQKSEWRFTSTPSTQGRQNKKTWRVSARSSWTSTTTGRNARWRTPKFQTWQLHQSQQKTKHPTKRPRDQHQPDLQASNPKRQIRVSLAATHRNSTANKASSKQSKKSASGKSSEKAKTQVPGGRTYGSEPSSKSKRTLQDMKKLIKRLWLCVFLHACLSHTVHKMCQVL